MKKKNYILIPLIIGCIFTISSCKKNDNPGNGSGNSGLLKSWIAITTYGGVSDTTTTSFTYDNQNRVVTQITATIQGSDTVTYTYNTGSVVQTISSISTVTYTLNSEGFRTSDNLGDTWTYNSAGYVVSSTSVNGTTTYTYNSSNELATKTLVNGGVTTTDTYTYGSNQGHSAGSSWSTGKVGGALFASDMTVKTGSANTTLTATYQFNSQNNLSESIFTSTASGSSPVYTYYIYY